MDETGRVLNNDQNFSNKSSSTYPTSSSLTENASGSFTSAEYQNSSSNLLSISTDRSSVGWILSQTVTLFFTLVCLYITIAIVYHKYKLWKEIRLLNGNKFSFSLNTISSRTTNINNNNNDESNKINQRRREEALTIAAARANQRSSTTTIQTALELLTIASAVFITLRSASEQLKLFLSDIDNNTCNIIADIHVLLYAFPVATIYAFLWLRQRILYFQKPLSAFNSKKVRRGSIAIFAVMLIGEIVTMLVFTLTITYEPGDLGCLVDETILPRFVPWLMIGVFTVTFQIALLGLYIGPLICIRMRNEEDSIRRHGKDKIGGTIKRVCIATFACVISDMAAVLVTNFIPISIASNLIYDLNLIVNLIGIICSFKNWRRRLFPFFTCHKGVIIEASQITMASTV